MGAKTQRPLAGAAIVLCLITGERECTLQADLAARVGEDGSFELSEVPPGVYVVLYDPSGKAMEGWKEIDQMMINYEIDKRNRIPLSDEFHEVFMAGGMLTVHNLSVTFKEGEVVDFDGAVTSSKHGLTMEFYDLNPIMVDVKPGETSNVEIAALATDVTP